MLVSVHTPRHATSSSGAAGPGTPLPPTTQPLYRSSPTSPTSGPQRAVREEKGKHMLRHHQQLIRSLALTGMATAALIAPHAASARPAADPQHVLQAKHVLIDLRTPDAVTPVVIQPTKVDLRSPDAATPI